MIKAVTMTIAFAVCSGGLAAATSDALPSGPAAVAGTYLLGADGEGSRLCRIRLRTPGTIGGYQISVPASCAASVARASDLTAWYVTRGGRLHLADAERHTVYDLKKMDAAHWSGTGPDGTYLLFKTPSAHRTTAPRTAR